MISRKTIETLIDLVEIRLSCVEVYDREDARELANLERCLEELMDQQSELPNDLAPVVRLGTKVRQRRRVAG